MFETSLLLLNFCLCVYIQYEYNENWTQNLDFFAFFSDSSVLSLSQVLILSIRMWEGCNALYLFITYECYVETLLFRVNFSTLKCQ